MVKNLPSLALVVFLLMLFIHSELPSGGETFVLATEINTPPC